MSLELRGGQVGRAASPLWRTTELESLAKSLQTYFTGYGGRERSDSIVLIAENDLLAREQGLPLDSTFQ